MGPVRFSYVSLREDKTHLKELRARTKPLEKELEPTKPFKDSTKKSGKGRKKIGKGGRGGTPSKSSDALQDHEPEPDHKQDQASPSKASDASQEHKPEADPKQDQTTPSTSPDDASKQTHPDDRATKPSFEAFKSAQGAIVNSPVINQAARDQTSIQNQNIKRITVNFLSDPLCTILSVIFDPILWKQPTIQPSFTTEVLKKLLAILQDATVLLAPALAGAVGALITLVLYERPAVGGGQHMLLE